MWADTLLAMERAHYDRLLVWGGASAVVGLLLVAVLVLRRVPSPLLRWFGLVTAVLGAINVVLVLNARRTLALRDHDGATALDRILWLNLGLDVGYVGIGLAIALTGWVIGRRLAPVGAGLGVIVQGAALFVLDLVMVQGLMGKI